MPIGAFCAFLGSVRLVRYFTDFLGHVESWSFKKYSLLFGENGTRQAFQEICFKRRLQIPAGCGMLRLGITNYHAYAGMSRRFFAEKVSEN